MCAIGGRRNTRKRRGRLPSLSDFQPSCRHPEEDCPLALCLGGVGPIEMLIRVLIEVCRRRHITLLLVVYERQTNS
jgi:hypothetical protein